MAKTKMIMQEDVPTIISQVLGERAGKPEKMAAGIEIPAPGSGIFLGPKIHFILKVI